MTDHFTAFRAGVSLVVTAGWAAWRRRLAGNQVHSPAVAWSNARVAVLGGSLLASAAFLVPLTAVFRIPGIGIPGILVLLGFGLSAARPLAGLAALIVVLPLTAVQGALVPMGGVAADIALLTFAAGASLQLARPHTGRPARLFGPVVVLMAAVLASTAIELREMQAVVPLEPLLADLWRHLTTDFWTDAQSFVVVHHAVRWMAGLTAALYAERLVGGRTAAPVWITRTWIVAGAVGGLATLAHLREVTRLTGRPFLDAVVRVAPEIRLSALQPDLNAAGSYFALFLVPVLIVGLRRRVGWMLGLGLPLVGLAFWLARSRAALGALVIVLCAHEGLRLLRSRRVRLAAGAVVLGLAAMAALLVATARSHVGLGAAAQIRVQLTEVGLATARRYPVFGVGLGDYVRMSRRWIAPDMTALLHFASQGENAHNNYLQIVVELGIPAGLVFLAMVGRMAALGWSGWDDRRARSEMPTPELEGLALGFSAFLLSAVFGHPLLIPLVSATFFLALGLLAGLAPVPAPRGPNRALAIQAAVLFYAVSLVWRLR